MHRSMLFVIGGFNLLQNLSTMKDYIEIKGRNSRKQRGGNMQWAFQSIMMLLETQD